MKPQDIKPTSPIPSELVSHDLYLNPVKAQDVVQFRDGKIYLGGLLLQDNELWNIGTEINYLKKMRIWSIYQETLRKQAYDNVFCRVGSQNEPEVMRGGKWMLYCLDEILAIANLLETAAKQRLPKGGVKKAGVV